MNRRTEGGDTQTIILFLIVILIAGLGYRAYSLSTIGYASGYEGASASFIGVYYNEYAYEGTDFRGTTMNFDVDDPKWGKPNLIGEMTTIFIPENTRFSQIPEWVPDPWKYPLDLIDNPQEEETYEWEVKEGDIIHFYRMEKWLTKWYVSFEAGFDTWGIIGDAEGNNKRLRNMEVWFEIETKPSWYFEDAERTYFAIAKIEVANIKLEGHEIEKIDIIPESAGSSLFLFYEPYGGDPSYREDEFLGYATDGTHLNPDLFGRTVYTMIELTDFGTSAWVEAITQVKNQGDVVTYEFTVHQFVVGEWKVQDIQELPPLDDPESEYGRESKVIKVGFNVREWIVTPDGMMVLGMLFTLMIAIWLVTGGLGTLATIYLARRQ